jgi:hypothetical protein
MMTMQITNTASASIDTAHTRKAPVNRFVVGTPMVFFGTSAILLLIITNTTADATADRTPNTPAKPANRYVCCRPCPKS